MILKIILSVAIVILLIWLYIDPKTEVLVANIIAAAGLMWTIYHQKNDSEKSKNSSFIINSGKKSINTQTTGTVNLQIERDVRKK